MRPHTCQLSGTRSLEIFLKHDRTYYPSRRCLTARSRPPSTAKRQNVREDTINVFEQSIIPSANGTTLRSTGPPVRVQERIRELEREINKLKDHPPDEMLADMQLKGTGSTNNILSHDVMTIAHVHNAACAFENRRHARCGTQQAVTDTITPKVELRLPANQAKSLRHFNQAMHQASTQNFRPETVHSLWRCYRASKEAVPGFLHQLPASAWDLLWNSQYNHTSPSDARSKHLWILLDDMQLVAHPLSSCQKMVQIEANFASGRFDQAKELWTAANSEISDSAEYLEAYWTMGTRIYLATNDTKGALRFALGAARMHPKIGVSASIPVFEQMLRSSVNADVEQAAHTYFQLRIVLGDSITLKDFDRLTLIFLTSRQPELAIGVFKDMLISLADRSGTASTGSLHHGLFQEFQSQIDTEGKTNNQLPLRMLQHLPRRFQNKFFYASWLKRLIGLDELEAALRVLELMHHRKIRPDAKHLNGLISAWMRRGTASSRALALDLGKSMIRARLHFVAARHSPDIEASNDSAAASPVTSLPPFLIHSVPPATIETFSILLLYYEGASMTNSMIQLQETLHLAELAPNIFFVNHILCGYLRTGKMSEAWDLYCLTNRNHLKPDMYTFAILWDICRCHIELHAPGKGQNFPSPRALFAHMANWFGTLSSKDAAFARNAMTSEIYAQIIRCMYLARDIRGTLVALYALRDMLHRYPDEKTLRVVAMLIARMGEPLKTQRVRVANDALIRRRRSVKILAQESLANLDHVLRILEAIKIERQKNLEAQGVQPDGLNHQQKGEEILWQLGRFLQDCLNQYGNEDAVDPQKDKTGRPANSVIASGRLDTTDRLEALAFEMGGFNVNVIPPFYAAQLDRA